MSELVEKIDRWGQPAWIGLMVLGFIVFWPIGLALLAYMLWTDRLGSSVETERLRRRVAAKWQRATSNWGPAWQPPTSGARPSGSPAFDAYRQDILRRLEEEEIEFRNYLERLRTARDRAEFDQFIKDRRPPRAPGDGPVING